MRISTLIDVILCLFDFASSFTLNFLRLTGSFIKKASILSLIFFFFLSSDLKKLLELYFSTVLAEFLDNVFFSFVS